MKAATMREALLTMMGLDEATEASFGQAERRQAHPLTGQLLPAGVSAGWVGHYTELVRLAARDPEARELLTCFLLEELGDEEGAREHEAAAERVRAAGA